MTDRYCALTVVLDETIRKDDAQKVLAAIRMVKGVVEVRPVVASPEAYWARATALRELKAKLWDILRGD